jgi:hypothetical protein
MAPEAEETRDTTPPSPSEKPVPSEDVVGRQSAGTPPEPAEPVESEPPAQPSAPEAAHAPEPEVGEEVEKPSPETQWHIAYRGERYGPYSTSRMWELIEEGRVKPRTNVWNRVMGEWRKAGNVLPFAAAWEDADE